VFLVLADDRRHILHFYVIAHRTAEWTGQQLRQAFPFGQLPHYLLRDLDNIFGNDFQDQLRDMGIREVLSVCRAGDWFDSARVPRPSIVFNETSLCRTLRSYFDYNHQSRTHLSWGKDSPEPRQIQPVEMGRVVAVSLVGGLHHRYERRAACATSSFINSSC